MTYNELKKIIENDDVISKRLYICNFFTCNVDKMKTIEVSLVKNIYGNTSLQNGWIMSMENM